MGKFKCEVVAEIAAGPTNTAKKGDPEVLEPSTKKKIGEEVRFYDPDGRLAKTLRHVEEKPGAGHPSWGDYKQGEFYDVEPDASYETAEEERARLDDEHAKHLRSIGVSPSPRDRTPATGVDPSRGAMPRATRDE